MRQKIFLDDQDRRLFLDLLGKEIAQPRHFSENSAQSVDKAVKELLSTAEKQAMDLIVSHRKELVDLINELETHESLNGEQIQACLGKKISKLS